MSSCSPEEGVSSQEDVGYGAVTQHREGSRFIGRQFCRVAASGSPPEHGSTRRNPHSPSS